MIDAITLNKIKTVLTRDVDLISEEDIRMTTDPVLHITYFTVKVGKGELILPESKLPILRGKNEHHHSSTVHQQGN